MTDGSSTPRDRVTRMLQTSARRAPEELLAEVYSDLRQLAESYLRRERSDVTLEPAALVNEAYLRLVHGDTVDWQGRTHFFAVGARAMRRLLIDHARGKGRLKRGGDRLRVTLDDGVGWPQRDLDAEQLLALHDALDGLRQLDPRQARIVELKFFSGMTSAEIAGELDVSVRTVDGHWAHARAWLLAEMGR